MAPWGPDGLRVRCEGAAGLGQCVLNDTPEAQFESLPWSAPDQSVWVTAEARLDNRDDLCSLFGISIADRSRVADGTIVRMAYERWGHRCPGHLIGDWSLAAWHTRERRLFLARDHFGQTALYYTWDGRRLAFSSDKGALLDLPFVSRALNEYRLAQRMVVWVGDATSETLHAAINWLRPAHTLTLERGQILTSQYWSLADAPDVRLPNAEAYADGLREHLDQAVRDRLRCPGLVAATVSGGLDSPSVAVLAARQLADGNRLLALTSVPRYDTTPYTEGRIGNEFPLAQAALSHFANVEHLAVDSAQIGPLAGVRRMLEIQREPGLAAGNQFWILAIHEAARAHGARVLLTGQQGNATISWHGQPTAAGMWAAGGPYAILREGLALTRFKLAGPVKHTMLRLASRLSSKAPWYGYSAIHPDFASRMRLLERMQDAAIDPYFFRESPTGRLAREWVLRPSASITGARWAQTCAAHGMVCRDPTSDVRLMTFVHGIPERFWRGPIDRWLIRLAMDGILPDEVRLGRVSGRQGGDLVPRLRAEGEAITAVLGQMSASTYVGKYLDLNRLDSHWSAVRTGTSRHQTNLLNLDAMVLIRGLAQGIFLLSSRHF